MDNKYTINDVSYICEFQIENADGQTFKFPKSVMRGMLIEDNFFEPFMSGSITLANPFDLIEEKYLFRGDGRDTIKIKFYPAAELDDKKKFDEEFIIVGDDNYVNPLSRAENMRTFQLVHKDALQFMEKIPHGEKYHGKVGNILKHIFQKMGCKVGKWTEGDFTLTYIPPLTYRYIDVVYYLLKIYYAKKGESYVKGFINFNKEERKYELNLLSDIFENNKDNIIDVFVTGEFTDSPELTNENNPTNEKVEASKHFNLLKNIGYSTPMYGWNNNNFVNRLVFAYDPISGVQKIKRMKLEDYENKWKQMFVDVFTAMKGRPLPFLPKNKSGEKKYKHFRTPFLMENSEKIVEADFYNVLTFYNLQTVFNNVGALQRYSGKFLDIIKFGESKKEINEDTGKKEHVPKYDHKILGTWFITKVSHKFLGDGYTNEFVCSKTYVGPDTKISNDAQ